MMGCIGSHADLLEGSPHAWTTHMHHAMRPQICTFDPAAGGHNHSGNQRWISLSGSESRDDSGHLCSKRQVDRCNADCVQLLDSLGSTDTLSQAFQEGQDQRLAAALSKTKAVGRCSIAGAISYDVAFIQMQQTPTGRKIVFITSRPHPLDVADPPAGVATLRSGSRPIRPE